ncbi:hypothetical protein AAZX31_12G140700 [Glycine max]|uniref:Uncharacterized protein n=1 Tax=Glycine soja TaxID=3848 RepID=A0A0B2P9V6_GLYSO|nr:hypothetical protein JHK87_033856 [Glycine soja]KAG4980667.1 hypothetical protein JHK85_034625 [Glycine max]KAG4986303.1 hypothetical protein JHK86_033994 [Glycine max]KAG5119493.1 hypothetical protein JHK82_033913 [Glycine max]KAG5140484.1 hypothetical protein JHK84_034252 [Glycine max]
MNGAMNIEKQLIEYEGDSKPTKTNDLQVFIGSNIPTNVEILPPQLSKTKGSGKQIKGGKEKVVEQQQKNELGYVKHVVNMHFMIVVIVPKSHLPNFGWDEVQWQIITLGLLGG